MKSTRKYKNQEEYVIEEIKPQTLQKEMDFEMEVVEYEPTGTLETKNQMNELIIEPEELKGDIQDCSGLNSYCCQEYFDSFESLLSHMAENHFGTLRKSVGAKKEVIKKCLDQYESVQYLEEQEELWVEESLDYEVIFFSQIYYTQVYFSITFFC